MLRKYLANPKTTTTLLVTSAFAVANNLFGTFRDKNHYDLAKKVVNSTSDEPVATQQAQQLSDDLLLTTRIQGIAASLIIFMAVAQLAWETRGHRLIDRESVGCLRAML